MQLVRNPNYAAARCLLNATRSALNPRDSSIGVGGKALTKASRRAPTKNAITLAPK